MSSKHKEEDFSCNCPVCGESCYNTQAGYHNISGHKGLIEQMHVHCAETHRDVYLVYQAYMGCEIEGQSICCDDIDEALAQVKHGLQESDIDDGYAIVKDSMSNLKYYSLQEFTGY